MKSTHCFLVLILALLGCGGSDGPVAGDGSAGGSAGGSAAAGGTTAAGAGGTASAGAGAGGAAAGGGEAAGGGGKAGGAALPCAEQCGKAECPCPTGEMISHTWMPPNQATKSWRIDKTEVTKASYAAFLAASPKDPAGWPSLCQERQRKGFVPELIDTEKIGCHWDLPKFPNEPIQCVDWCDAYAYCAWAGKRLCGGTVVGIDPAQFAYEWDVPCGGPALQKYPYGNDYVEGACNIPQKSDQMGQAKDVGSTATCTSPGGEVDMLGNVSEWVDWCGTVDGNLKCGAAGGSATVGNSMCGKGPGGFDPLFVGRQFGIRCCADAN